MSAQDIEMKDAEKEELGNLHLTLSASQIPVAEEEDPSALYAKLKTDIKAVMTLCERASKQKEERYLSRALRKIPSLRKRMSTTSAKATLLTYLPSSDFVSKLLKAISQVPVNDMDIIEDNEEHEKVEEVIPEVELYSYLLALIFIIDNKHPEAPTIASEVIQKLGEARFQSRHLDVLAAKMFFYYARSYDIQGKIRNIRTELLAAFRTACLQHFYETQATLLNMLLRSYIDQSLYAQADTLVGKTSWNEDVSSNQLARYLYYKGRIRAVQLEYSEAYDCLLQASRKAPQAGAVGFRVTVGKLAAIVQLLMGEIPEKRVFHQLGLTTRGMEAYYQLALAVRNDLDSFNKVVKKYQETFRRDGNFSLIQRLHRNVIKIGLRKISVSYSRISFKDICNKLHLDNEKDCEFIVAKAIRDGVIEATINHTGGYIQSKEIVDVYATTEPQEQFHQRISLCLQMHNDAVLAMRFPPDAHKRDVESEEARKERLKQEEELAKEIAEEDDEDDI